MTAPSESQGVVSQVAARIAEFKREVGYAADLPIRGPYSHYDDPKGEVLYPCSSEPGCYFFANPEGPLFYIGSTIVTLGKRLSARVGRKGREGEPPLPDAPEWFSRYRPSVWVIPFSHEHRWLAAALEVYLIDTLRPLINRRPR